MVPAGEGVGVTPDEPPPHAANVRASATAAKRMEARLGMAGSLRRLYSKYRCDLVLSNA